MRRVISTLLVLAAVTIFNSAHADETSPGFITIDDYSIDQPILNPSSGNPASTPIQVSEPIALNFDEADDSNESIVVFNLVHFRPVNQPTVIVDRLISQSELQEPSGTLTVVCHTAGINPVNRDIKVPANELAAHLAHGDSTGSCSGSGVGFDIDVDIETDEIDEDDFETELNTFLTTLQTTTSELEFEIEIEMDDDEPEIDEHNISGSPSSEQQAAWDALINRILELMEDEGDDDAEVEIDIEVEFDDDDIPAPVKAALFEEHLDWAPTVLADGQYKVLLGAVGAELEIENGGAAFAQIAQPLIEAIVAFPLSELPDDEDEFVEFELEVQEDDGDWDIDIEIKFENESDENVFVSHLPSISSAVS